jgi:hypothetical protein
MNSIKLAFAVSLFAVSLLCLSTRSIAADSATIRIQTDVVNENHVPTPCRITTRILDKKGKQVKEVSVDKTIPGDTTASVDQECAVDHPY